MSHPLIPVVNEQIPKLRRHLQPRAPQLNLPQRNRRLRLPPNPNRSLIPAAASRSSFSVGAWSSYPHPQCFSLRSVIARIGAPRELEPGCGQGVERLVIFPRPRPRTAADCLRKKLSGTPCPHPAYQCTPFIRCAKATASVVGGLSGASSPFPLAACDSGNSLYARLRTGRRRRADGVHHLSDVAQRGADLLRLVDHRLRSSRRLRPASASGTCRTSSSARSSASARAACGSS